MVSGDCVLVENGEFPWSLGCGLKSGNPMKIKKKTDEIARITPVTMPPFLFIKFVLSSPNYNRCGTRLLLFS
jgi:hypothetical protein